MYVYTIKSKYMYILISRREIHAMKCKRKWKLNATNNKKKRRKKKCELLVFEIATVAYLLFDQEIYLRTFFVLLSLCSSLLMLSRRNVHGNIITFASYTGKMPTLYKKKILFFLFSSRYFLIFSCCFYNRK